MLRRVRLIISGQVQGVNLRSETAAYARTHELAGWIRNDASGTVTVEAEGESTSIAKLVVWLRQDQHYGRVAGIATEELPTSGDKDFRIERWWHNIA